MISKEKVVVLTKEKFLKDLQNTERTPKCGEET